MRNFLYSILLSKSTKIKIYITLILPAFYGCETWSLTMRKERRLKFENRVLRRIFEPKRDEVTGEKRKLRNEELNVLHCSSNIRGRVK